MSLDRVQSLISEIIRVEGREFTNDPNDSGGPTKFGITQRDLSAYFGRPASIDDVRGMSELLARSIYMQRYVTGPQFDKILAISDKVGEEVIDTGVNCGVYRAGEFLQRCLNALNRQQKDYADVAVDGKCGTKTQDALRKYLTIRREEGEKVLLRALNALQGEFYIRLAEGRPKDETFLYGWLLNRVA